LARRRLAIYAGAKARKENPINSVELERELVALKPRQAAGKMVDGVVWHGQRAVPPGVLGLELIVRIELLARIHLDDRRFAVPGVNTASVRVEYVLGVDQIAMIPQQP